MDVFESYYTALRRKNQALLNKRRERCAAMNRGFSRLFAARERAFSLPPREAKESLAALAKEEKELLRQCELPENYLEPLFSCPLCKDTGYVGSPLKKKCACRMALEQQRLGESARINRREAFSAFSPAVYPNDMQRRQGEKILAYCQKYADSLPSPEKPQLILYGMPGLGKSFFGNAIALSALQRGIDSLRLTAYRMTEEVMEGFSSEKNPLGRYVSVPLLVLDDLGSEPMINNVTVETLFAIADQRSSGRLATIYITNLSGAEIQSRYGERIASRIADASLTLTVPFTGESLRKSREGRS